MAAAEAYRRTSRRANMATLNGLAGIALPARTG